MTNYLETKIREIHESDFQSMVSDLCLCIQLDKKQFVNWPLSYLLMASVKEQRALARYYLPTNGILTTKVDKLPYDSVVHCVCRELADRARMNIEVFDGKSLLSLINRCRKACCPELPRTKRTTRMERNRRFQAELISQRRKNGVL